MYPSVLLQVAGVWREACGGIAHPILNPATGEEIGSHPVAAQADLDEALLAADRGFKQWRAVSPYERGQILRKSASLLRERAETIARIMTIEQGKPLAEARLEIAAGADFIDWAAEEGRRVYGRVIPARGPGVAQLVVREPVGPVAAFTPWNFPIVQAARKVASALSTGCSVILKGPEEAPASCAEMARAFLDAGVPADALSFVLGSPAEISSYLIAHPVIRKISFTGSTVVGKTLAALAGQHMKRATMELGGHAPALIFSDADLDRAVTTLAANKFRNAGQVCISPSRFLVQASVMDQFIEKFVATARQVRVGDGLDPQTTMGPLAHERRLLAMEQLVSDAREQGAEIRLGGGRFGNRGYFFEPTVIANASLDVRVMNEEPFGPIAVMRPFYDVDEAVAEANRLPFGLAAYAYTRSMSVADKLAASVECGMISINHHGLGLPENPFGGVKDSGYGSEGGSEALEGYLVSKLVSRTN
ncbi:NAD-dependent succinate-semialdehyde dehydrogenase [Bradyrhizobium sp. 31Argb]|uniref:NAD-dependent succinate-semialdehyde dehydrogenase n=1 Tax=Bradyrhizobium sp. 31Argb TaxID=3141247 RepID=UPI0037478F8F